MNKIIKTSLVLVILCLCKITYSQTTVDVENAFDRFKKKAFKFSGGLSANQVLYNAWGDIENRRSPYTYYLSGNLNAAFYGWNFPFSFSVSDQKSEYQTPPLQSFDRFGIAPYYKWVKLYGGYSNMTFSPYSLNGYTFLGAGAELTPGIFNFSTFYGRLNEAVEEDTSQNITPVYKRMGYGFKFGIKSEDNFIDIMFFRAQDDVKSLQYVSDSSEVKPGENVVLGIKGGTTLLKKIKLDAEYSSSAFTRDIRLEEQTEKAPFIFANIKGIFTPRVSSNYYNAFRTAVNYAESNYGMGLAYERVAPGYETMGAYYFNNDLEKITVNGNTSLLKQKMQLAISFGIEENNLDHSKLSTMRKTVGSINLNYSPTLKWNFAFSYSNFTSFTNIRSNFETINQVNPYEQIDTLDFTQLTQSANANISYLIGDSSDVDKKQFLNLNLSSQIAANEQQGNSNSGSKFYNANLSYTISLIPKNTSITAAMMSSYTEMPQTYTTMLGPMASISKLFFEKKLRTSTSIAWNRTYINSEISNTILNFRANAGYTLKKSHTFNLSLVLLDKSEKSEERKSFTEFTVTLGYSYSFTTSDEKKKIQEKKEIEE
jgi:hypothetical protein